MISRMRVCGGLTKSELVSAFREDGNEGVSGSLSIFKTAYEQSDKLQLILA